MSLILHNIPFEYQSAFDLKEYLHQLGGSVQSIRLVDNTNDMSIERLSCFAYIKCTTEEDAATIMNRINTMSTRLKCTKALDRGCRINTDDTYVNLLKAPVSRRRRYSDDEIE